MSVNRWLGWKWHTWLQPSVAPLLLLRHVQTENQLSIFIQFKNLKKKVKKAQKKKFNSGGYSHCLCFGPVFFRPQTKSQKKKIWADHERQVNFRTSDKLIKKGRKVKKEWEKNKRKILKKFKFVTFFLITKRKSRRSLSETKIYSEVINLITILAPYNKVFENLMGFQISPIFSHIWQKLYFWRDIDHLWVHDWSRFFSLKCMNFY